MRNCDCCKKRAGKYHFENTDLYLCYGCIFSFFEAYKEEYKVECESEYNEILRRCKRIMIGPTGSDMERRLELAKKGIMNLDPSEKEYFLKVALRNKKLENKAFSRKIITYIIFSIALMILINIVVIFAFN